jgi:hypothetical protein
MDLISFSNEKGPAEASPFIAPNRIQLHSNSLQLLKQFQPHQEAIIIIP